MLGKNLQSHTFNIHYQKLIDDYNETCKYDKTVLPKCVSYSCHQCGHVQELQADDLSIASVNKNIHTLDNDSSKDRNENKKLVKSDEFSRCKDVDGLEKTFTDNDLSSGINSFNHCAEKQTPNKMFTVQLGCGNHHVNISNSYHIMNDNNLVLKTTNSCNNIDQCFIEQNIRRNKCLENDTNPKHISNDFIDGTKINLVQELKQNIQSVNLIVKPLQINSSENLDHSESAIHCNNQPQCEFPPPPLPLRSDSLDTSDDCKLKTAPWFQAGIPREIALEILSQEPCGSFLVRESTTKLGCYALSLRVPKKIQPSGIAHYLIIRTQKGYKIKGFTKEFLTLTSLIIHHSVMPELLPCPLMLNRSVTDDAKINAKNKYFADISLHSECDNDSKKSNY